MSAGFSLQIWLNYGEVIMGQEEDGSFTPSTNRVGMLVREHAAAGCGSMKKQLHWLVVVAVVIAVGGLADAVFAQNPARQHIRDLDPGPSNFVKYEPGLEGDPTGGFHQAGNPTGGGSSESNDSDSSGDSPSSSTGNRNSAPQGFGRVFLRTLVGFVLSPNQPVLVLSGR